MLKHTIFATLTTTLLSASAVYAENVEIYLEDMLDNIQSGYCVDIAGAKGDQANPDDGLQGHTCYSPLGALGVDQIFDTSKFADNVLYMPKFDVCAQAPSVNAGTTLDLAKCDGSQAQSFIFSGQGTITPATATEMCLTLAEGTRFGRSKANQIKVMSLETCDQDPSAYQSWNIRSKVD